MIKMDIKRSKKRLSGHTAHIQSYEWMQDLLMNIDNKVCPRVL
jgi:hypothetical protein